MKKALSMLLAIIMVLSLMPMSVFATSNPTIYFETDFTTELEVGDKFTVTAHLKDNTRFDAMTLTLRWNDKAVKFNGFEAVRGTPVSEVFNAAEGYSPASCNQETGKFAGFDQTGYGYDNNGKLFTANFEIVGEGALDIGLMTDNTEVFEMVDNTGAAQNPILDFTALENLTVGGKPVGPEMPENAPFTAITTDAGAILDIKYLDEDEEPLTLSFNNSDVPYYIVTIPANATQAYVTAPDQVVMEAGDMSREWATGYAVDLSDTSVSYMPNYDFTMDGEAVKVIVPMNMHVDANPTWYQPAYDLCFVADAGDVATHAFGIEDKDFACLGLISFVYEEAGEGEEIYNINIADDIVGGTLTATDENGDPITEAAAGDCLFLTNQADTGYTFKHYLINGNVVTEAELGMSNDFYIMHAADITVSAVFEEVAPEIEPNPITKINLSHPNIVTDDEGNMTMSMVTGASETIDLSYTVQNAELASTQVVAWSSSDPEVASVENGKVTALKAGSTVITAKAVDESTITLLANGEDVLAQFTLTVSNPADGYAVNMGADKTVVANETVQIPVTVTHSDPNVTDYKSFEFTFQYDPALLTLVTGSSEDNQKEITVTDNNGTVTVRRYGNALKVGDAAITLEFTAKAVGNTNVKLITAKVGTSDDAKDENIPTAQIEDNLTEITVSGYTVNLPDEFEGETDKPVVAPGESYTFEAKDKNYTYEVKATIDGVEITVNSNEDGTSFTIPEGEIDGNVVVEIAKKEGKKFEITLKGDSLAHESGYTTEGEKTYARYMTAYTAKLTEKDHYIYDLKVTVNNAAVEYDYNSETGIITIAGNLITGPVVIESGEKESEKHDVKFEGAYASHAKYEGESAVYNGESFSFTIETPAGLVIESYQVSYKMGDAEEYTTLEANDGTYTVEKVTAALTIKIEGTSDLKVEVNEYVKLNGKTVFLVTATQTLPEGKNLAYDTNVMYLKNFQVEDSDTMEQMYSYLVVVGPNETLSVEDATAMITIVEAQATTLLDTFNVNESSALDINDAQLVYDLYNNVYQDIDIVGMQKFLRADVNGSRNINVSDAAAVVNAILE